MSAPAYAHRLCASHSSLPLRTINEIVELHRRGVITDGELEVLVRVLGTDQVETEFSTRVSSALDKIQERLYKMIVETHERSPV